MCEILTSQILIRLILTDAAQTKMPKLRETAYNTPVRPQLEYASAVCDPHNKVRIFQIEQVQRRAARWTVSNFDRQTSVTQIVEDLGWRTLEHRRADFYFTKLFIVWLPYLARSIYRTVTEFHGTVPP